MFAQLLAKGCDVNAATGYGTTALMMATMHGQTATVARLLEAGAESSAKTLAYAQKFSVADASRSILGLIGAAAAFASGGKKAGLRRMLAAAAAGGEEESPTLDAEPRGAKADDADLLDDDDADADAHADLDDADADLLYDDADLPERSDSEVPEGQQEKWDTRKEAARAEAEAAAVASTGKGGRRGATRGGPSATNAEDAAEEQEIRAFEEKLAQEQELQRLEQDMMRAQVLGVTDSARKNADEMQAEAAEQHEEELQRLEELELDEEQKIQAEVADAAAALLREQTLMEAEAAEVHNDPCCALLS